jgi:AcrR family transcriptional regulator
MPKLNANDILKNKRKIESAALQVFVKQGFHGTSIRDIANASGVSIGNIYTYYKTKEALYLAIVEHYESRVQHLLSVMLDSLDDVFEPAGVEDLALKSRDIVYAEPDYWRLMYIDVTEFGNQHFAHSFRTLSANLKVKLGRKLSAKALDPQLSDVDPALAFTAIYLNFFTYFLVEKLFGGKHHLGVPDEQAVKQMVTIYTRGLGTGKSRTRSKTAKAGGKR